MKIIIQIAQFLLSLSILIILHELGHFIFARLFKTRVEKFYLFFDPWFSLFKVKKGETEYGIGWLPLGGYVKISGMIDESMDKEQLKQPPQPYEFRSKKSWQRLFIMIGGVLVNFILGMVLYAFILLHWGEKYLPNENLTDGIWAIDSLSMDIGLENGDKIVAANGQAIAKFEDITEELLYGGEFEILRNDTVITLEIPENFIEKLIEQRQKNKSSLLLYPRMPFIISDIPDTSQNVDAGLKPKDHVVGINNTPIKYYDEYLVAIDSLKNRDIDLMVLRDSNKITVPVHVTSSGKIEVIAAILGYNELEKLGIYQFKSFHYNFFQAIPAGMHKAVDKLKMYVRQFKLVFNFKSGAYKGIGGFGTIASLFPPEWNWQVFWELTAFLSIILAFMNLLPIPALDGGHVIFLLYEMITGRKPHDKVLEYAQIIGMILVIFLLLYANINDVYQWILRKF